LKLINQQFPGLLCLTSNFKKYKIAHKSVICTKKKVVSSVLENWTWRMGIVWKRLYIFLWVTWTGPFTFSTGGHVWLVTCSVNRMTKVNVGI